MEFRKSRTIAYYILFTYTFAMPLFLGAQNNIDSTKKGYFRAQISLFCKNSFDFRNTFSRKKYNNATKNSDNLVLPESCKNYKRTFVDSFNILDQTKWSAGQPWGRYHPSFPHQYYGDSQIFVKDGILHLLNERKMYTFNKNKSDSITIPYGTGLINSFNQICFQYGYFAIRSKNPSGPGTWPAFWLTGKNNWPPEIDIFEMYGGKDGKKIHEQTMTIHVGKTETHTKRMILKAMNLPTNTDSVFHIYACHWEPKKITFYTDGVKIKTIKLSKWMRQFYKEPMYLIVNNALDHNYLKEISTAKMPQDFQVDWVQVYQQ
jgi:beta-glucanase (GH16 family)